MKLLRALLPLLIVTPNLASASRDSPLPDSRGGYLTFYLDNDLFGGEDRDYTNGGRLSWISEDREISQLGSFQRLLRPFSGDPDSFSFFRKITRFEDPEKIRYNFGFSLTQLMFTPEDFTSYEQPDGQRRYAGWLGLGFSLHVKDEHVLNSMELTVGTTGRNSLAETSQDFIHDLLGKDQFNGWDNQIPNEVTVDVSFVQKRRASWIDWEKGSFRLDGLSQWGVRLGTYRTDANVGGLVRFGYQLPKDFSDPRLSSTAYSHRYFGADERYDNDWSIYTMFGAGGTAVAQDASLDGPLFRDFRTGNRRIPFVAEVSAGLAVRYKEVELSYMHTWRTEEYREQVKPANFGSVAVRVRF